MRRRILFLTAGFGEGHNAAARALASAAERTDGCGSAGVIDVFALARPRLNTVTRKAYLSLINRAPFLWRSAYGWLDRSERAPRLVARLRREIRTLTEIVERERPDALCCTYPLYAFMIEAARGTGLLREWPPHYNIVTDSISINSLWSRCDCAGWFVPNEDSEAVLREGGVDPARIRALGFPVAGFFAEEQDRLAPPEFGPDTVPRVLYIINSGTRGAAETALRLLAEHDWDVTCTVGRDEKLRAALRRVAESRPRPASVLGWTDEIPRLLMTHHVVVSKAGGATTQEAIAARCPMLVNQIVPGQEEGNYELLRRHGIGGLAQTPEQVIAALKGAFADRGRVWSEWRVSLMRLARPRAAQDIVRAVLAERQASHPPTPAGVATHPLRSANLAESWNPP